MVAGSIELRMPMTSPLSFGKLGVSVFADWGTAYDKGERLRDQTFHTGIGGSVWLAVAGFRMSLASPTAWVPGTRVTFDRRRDSDLLGARTRDHWHSVITRRSQVPTACVVAAAPVVREEPLFGHRFATISCAAVPFGLLVVRRSGAGGSGVPRSSRA